MAERAHPEDPAAKERADVHLPPDYCIKPGYVARDYRVYFRDDCATAGITYQPDAYALAGELAELLDLRTIVDLGCGTAGKLIPLASVAKTVGIDFGDNLAICRNSHPDLTWVERNLEEDVLGPSIWAAWGPSVIVAADVIEHLLDPTALLRSIAYGLDAGGLAILSTPDRDLVRGADDYGPPANPHHIRRASVWPNTATPATMIETASSQPLPALLQGLIFPGWPKKSAGRLFLSFEGTRRSPFETRACCARPAFW